MKIDNTNVLEYINSFLKENKIRYNIEYRDNQMEFYKLHLGNLGCYIQVEYSEDDSNIIIQTFIKDKENVLST